MILNLILFALYVVLRIYQGIMLLSILFTWIPGVTSSKLGIIVGKTSDWYLGYFRGFIVLGGIDFTPMIGLAVYELVIQSFLY